MAAVKRFCFAMAILVTFEIVSINGIDHDKTVETSDGAIRGTKKTTEWKKVGYYSFQGIPYAEAPIGELRFKAPKPKNAWHPKVLDALEFGNICPQLGELLPSPYAQSEDCLFLNIYVPAYFEINQKLPVLFYIHGGAFAEGSGNDDFYGPDFFIEKRVILVTFNYRLSIFGFLSLNLPEYSGNMGLKDQQLALKWIHKNIAHFNGDNKKITVFGQSAGGVSTHFQILSSKSRIYFQNAITMSGVTSVSWAMSEHNDHLEFVQNKAINDGKTLQNTDELLNFLLPASTADLVKYGSIVVGMDRTTSLPFTPVIERPDAVDPFITKSVEKLYETEDIHINTMFTDTSAEMLMLITKALPTLTDVEGLNANFSIRLPFRSLELSPDSKEYRAVNDEIRQFYFGNDVINMSKSVEYVNLLSDLNFCYAIGKMAKFHASKSKGKTFYARFSVDSKLNIVKKTRAEFYHPGASHCDDLCYLFKLGVGKPFYDDVFNTQDDEQSIISIQTIEHMTNLFTKFEKIARAGRSISSGLKSIQNGEINFLDITNKGLISGLNPNGKTMEFWAKIEKRMKKYIKAKQYGKSSRKLDLILNCLGLNTGSQAN